MNRIRLTDKQLDLLTRISKVEGFEVSGADLRCARGLYHRRAPLVSIYCHDGGADITDVDAVPHFVAHLTALGSEALVATKVGS